MADRTYDLLIIGAGPGGYVCAIRARSRHECRVVDSARRSAHLPQHRAPLETRCKARRIPGHTDLRATAWKLCHVVSSCTMLARKEFGVASSKGRLPFRKHRSIPHRGP